MTVPVWHDFSLWRSGEPLWLARVLGWHSRRSGAGRQAVFCSQLSSWWLYWQLAHSCCWAWGRWVSVGDCWCWHSWLMEAVDGFGVDFDWARSWQIKFSEKASLRYSTHLISTTNHLQLNTRQLLPQWHKKSHWKKSSENTPSLGVVAGPWHESREMAESPSF